MKYYIIEGSEVNCSVEMLEDGFITDLAVYDEMSPFGFAYKECPCVDTEIEDCEVTVFDSRDQPDLLDILTSLNEKELEAFIESLDPEELEEYLTPTGFDDEEEDEKFDSNI